MSGQVQRTYKEPAGMTCTHRGGQLHSLVRARSCVFYIIIIINNIVLIERSTTRDGVCGDDDDGPSCLYYYYYYLYIYAIVRVWFLNETTSKGRSRRPIDVQYYYKL